MTQYKRSPPFMLSAMTSACHQPRHLICDGRGIPLAIQLAGANRNDSQLLADPDASCRVPLRRSRTWCKHWSLRRLASDSFAARQGDFAELETLRSSSPKLRRNRSGRGHKCEALVSVLGGLLHHGRPQCQEVSRSGIIILSFVVRLRV